MSYYKNGNISETFTKETRVEPDGSVWEQVFFHNNPTSNKFSSSDTFSTGVYKSSEMWFNFNICITLTSWEFLYIQAATSSSSEVKYRWIQTVSPFGTSYDAVKPSAVTRVTTTGYTDGGYGGLYVMNSNAYMIVANSSNGNWFGATGSWTAHQGGIPGYPNTVVTTGHISIFVRIDNTNSTNTFRKYKGIDMFNTYELIEY